MEKVFIVKFDWSTTDTDGTELFAYKNYSDAYDKFKKIICNERNPEMSWVGDIELDGDGNPLDSERYVFEFEDNNSGESEVYWHISERDNYYIHSFVDLLILEVK